jgi:hypothetical protein
VVAKKQTPLGLDKVNALFERVSGATPADLWPVRNTSSFELRPGEEPVSSHHPDFYERYEDIGAFPGAEPLWSSKAVQTRMLKVIDGLVAPIL